MYQNEVATNTIVKCHTNRWLCIIKSLQFNGTNFNNRIFRLGTLLDEKNLLKFIKEEIESIVGFLTKAADKEKARLD